MYKFYFFLAGIVISIYINYNVFISHQVQRLFLEDFNSGNYKEESTVKFNVLNRNFPNLSAVAIPIDYFLSKYYFLAEDYEKAFELLDSGKEANPYIQLGNILKSEYFDELGVKDSMSFYANMAFEKSPFNIRHFLGKMKAVSINDDEAELIRSFKIVKNHYDKNFSLVFLSTYLTFDSISDQMKKIADEIYRKFPASNDVKIARDFILYGKDNIQKAIEISDEAKIEFDSRNFEEAVKKYEKAINLNPGDYMYHQNLALSHIELKNFDDAISLLINVKDSLFRPSPIDGKAEYLLGYAQIQSGDKVNGCNNLKTSKNLNNPFGFKLFSQYCN